MIFGALTNLYPMSVIFLLPKYSSFQQVSWGGMSLYLTDDWITTHQCWFVDVESRELAL